MGIKAGTNMKEERKQTGVESGISRLGLASSGSFLNFTPDHLPSLFRGPFSSQLLARLSLRNCSLSGSFRFISAISARVSGIEGSSSRHFFRVSLSFVSTSSSNEGFGEWKSSYSTSWSLGGGVMLGVYCTGYKPSLHYTLTTDIKTNLSVKAVHGRFAAGPSASA